MITKPVRRIAYAGVFIAVSIILTRLASQMIYIAGVQILRLSFGEIPLILSGIILGPFYGAACGALADLIGFPINAQGAYFPGFTLSAALVGMLPGLMTRLVKKEWTWLSLSIVIGITTLITSVILNTIWLHMIIGKAVAMLLPARIIAALILTPIYISVVKLFLKHYKHIENRMLQ